MNKDMQDELRIEARTISVPNTISAPAREHLIRTSSTRKNRYVTATPGDWAAVAAIGNKIMTAHAEITGAAFRGKIEQDQCNGARVYEITPEDMPDDRAGDAIFYLHGGAYLFGGGRLCAASALRHAMAHRRTVFSVDYRMPPEAPFPAALDDAVAAYVAIVKRYGAGRVAVIGLSAGGGLAAALALRLRDEGLPAPASLVLLSPEADLAEDGDMMRACVYPMTFAEITALYANGHDVRHPYLSPIHGDFDRGYPPTMIQSGTRDFFLSCSVLLHRKLRRAGLQAELHVWEAMPHTGFGGMTPEDADVLREEVDFVDRHFGRAR